jgi:succinate dehydrogenase / fumarate reductase cytochrome b subunit
MSDNKTTTPIDKDNPISRPRPLSPHLQVYKPEFTSLTSILHRGSGVFLYFAAFLLVYFLASIAFWPQKECFENFWNAFYGKPILFLISAAVYYHLCNGVRHLFWDFGYGFSLPVAARSAIAVFAVSAFLTFATWFIILVG